MSAVTLTSTALASETLTEKAGIVTDVEPVASSTNSPVSEQDPGTNGQSNSVLLENEGNKIAPESEQSDSTKEKEDPEKDDSKSAVSVSAGETIALDEMVQKLLKKVEFMKQKLENELSITLDEDEDEGPKESESVADPTPDNDAEPEEEKEEEEEEPFSLDKQIKYVLTEKWIEPESRTYWRSYTGTTIVVSMKPNTASLVQDHTQLHTGGVSIRPSALNDIHSPAEVVEIPIQSGLQKDEKVAENDMGNCRPDRVAIVCPTLLEEVNRITGATLTDTTNVILPPYKILVPFYHEFSERMQVKEAICKRLLEEQEALKSSAPSVTVNGVADETEKKGKAEKDTQELSSEKQLELKTAQKIVNGMKCLLHLLDTHLHNSSEVYRQVKDHSIKEIAFENLWYLFKPGDVIVSRKPKDQAYRVLHVGGGRSSRGFVDEKGEQILKRGPKKMTDFFIDCYKMDFNGTHYGPVGHQIIISPYDGLRQITALDAVPISCVPDPAKGSSIEEVLLARGKKFVRLARVSHKQYKGLNLKEGPFRHEEVDGDTIIDFALAFKNSQAPYEIEPPFLGGGVIEEPTPENPAELREYFSGCGQPPPSTCCGGFYTYNDTEFDLRRRTEFKESPDINLNTVSAEEGKLGKERHILLPYRVYGYVLLSRKWYPLDIDLVKDVKETNKDTKDGFNDLVLPDDHKQIVRALVKTHARGPRSTSINKGESMLPSREIDLVKGKGKGLIILLHGVPGVGKTSTAECVAENTNRPLFPITCGDIGGTTAKEVETNLESYFDLARKWGCVLLLDEADVFLGERTKGDIVQNSLVSVFLRVLEYYSGILILTTNRVGQFDEAIKSRIHISLYYPPLTKKSTLEIWKMNLDRLERREGENQERRPIIFSRKEIMNFAKGHWANNEATKTNWNGRQIKNAFQTAIALAEWDFIDTQTNAKFKNESGPLLEARHFQKVAEASARFDQYLNSVRDTDMENAKAKNNRKDDFVDNGITTEAGLRYPTLKEARLAERARRSQTPLRDSDEGEDSGDSSDSVSDISDDDFKEKKREMELIRIRKEEQQKKKEDAEKASKRKLKEEKKNQQREAQEAKRREELSKSKEADSNDSDDSV